MQHVFVMSFCGACKEGKSTCEGGQQVAVPHEARLSALPEQLGAGALAGSLRVALLRQRDVRAVAEEQAAPRVARVQRRPQQLDVPAGAKAGCWTACDGVMLQCMSVALGLCEPVQTNRSLHVMHQDQVMPSVP